MTAATLIFRDQKGEGALVCFSATDDDGEIAIDTIDYLSGIFTVSPYALVPIKVPRYIRQNQGTKQVGTQIVTEWRKILQDFSDGLAAYIYAGGTVSASYLPAASTGTAAHETVTLDTLNFDLTLGYAEHITRNSLRFKIGDSVYVDRANRIYKDPSVETGAGSLAGSLDPTTGMCRITAWTAGIDNAVTLESLVTEVGSQPVDRVSFRTPITPIKPGTLQIRWSTLDGIAKSKHIDNTGKLEDSDATIDVDFARGVVHCRFGLWRIVSELTEADLAANWYSPLSIVTLDNVEKIWQPRLASAESILYNAVASTYLPPDSGLLGLDAAKLPPDGQALIYRVGQLVLTHHSSHFTVESLSPSQTIDCERTRLYRAAIEDSIGVRLGADQFTVNRATGIITLSSALDTSGFTPPWTVRHTVADLARVVDTDINGNLTLMSPLSHDYPALESYCSGVLSIGTLQSRVSNVFSQVSWTNEWADSRIGAVPLAQYADALYPISVKNEGAYPDRFLIKFTSATAFQVIGENLGLIAVGEISTDCEPVNQLTGKPYFFIDKRGWGLGWVTGNCLRFNTHGACYPIDLIRAIQPSQPTELADSVELLLIGNVDA